MLGKLYHLAFVAILRWMFWQSLSIDVGHPILHRCVDLLVRRGSLSLRVAERGRGVDSPRSCFGQLPNGSWPPQRSSEQRSNGSEGALHQILVYHDLFIGFLEKAPL